MKKIQVLVLSILFLSNINIYSDFLKSSDPYQGMAVGRSIDEILVSYKTVAKVQSILDGHVYCATDQEGNKTWRKGRFSLTIKTDGSVSSTCGAVTKSWDKEGNEISVSERMRGTNIIIMIDEFGERTGWKTLNANGTVYQVYDKDGNLKTTNYYDEETGKNIVRSVDEQTKQETIFDRWGRKKGVIDKGFGGDGYVISTCQYDDIIYERSQDGKSIIEIVNPDKKVDTKLLTTERRYIFTIDNINSDGSVNFSSGYNTVYYDKNGLISKVIDNNGITISEYFYNTDKYGNKVLTHVLNPTNKSITYYENGKPVEERNDMGGVTKTYHYNGSRLLYTVSMGSDGSFGDVTYYDTSGNALFTTHKFVKYDPSSGNRIDYVCGTEYSVRVNADEIKTMEIDKDYVIRKEYNKQTSQMEDVYYLVPTGAEGVNYIKKKVKNESTGEEETRFYTITEKYVYDNDGNINYVINLTNNTRTYYKYNYPYYIAANNDSTANINLSKTPNHPDVIAYYQYNKPLDSYDPQQDGPLTLICIHNVKDDTTQWYKNDGQLWFLVCNDRLVSNNIYDNGNLVGTWDNQKKELTILRDQKQWITVKLDSDPGVGFIRKILSYTSRDNTDWKAIDKYIDYHEFRTKLIDNNSELYNLVDTVEKYDNLKKSYEKFIEENENSEITFIQYLKNIQDLKDAKKQIQKVEMKEKEFSDRLNKMVENKNYLLQYYDDNHRGIGKSLVIDGIEGGENGKYEAIIAVSSENDANGLFEKILNCKTSSELKILLKNYDVIFYDSNMNEFMIPVL